jgi:uncharacterized protein (DUF58 family)
MIPRLQYLALGGILLLGALSTGEDFLWFLVYLGALVFGGSWLLTRLGLSSLEAGYLVDRQHASAGDTLQATYTVRNRSLLPKLWLEVVSPTTLPSPLPGRVISIGPRRERSWSVRVPLIRRGHYRIDPMLVRTGDPLGLFESYATVGRSTAIVVFPQVSPLPRWRLPPSAIEGVNAQPERSVQVTPLVTSIRPYVTGDAFNRIHWRTTARQQELQVKEFETEQTADLWLFLDLDRSVHAGADQQATIETAVEATASIATRALDEGRAFGFEAFGIRRVVMPPDRGPRQHQKLMMLLAAAQPDGSTPIRELLANGLGRIRRGMSVVVVTPSLDRAWVRQLAELRVRGVTSVVCLVDPLSHEQRTREAHIEPPLEDALHDAWARDLRAMRHALAEHEIASYVLSPGVPLGEQIVSRHGRIGAPV